VRCSARFFVGAPDGRDAVDAAVRAESVGRVHDLQELAPSPIADAAVQQHLFNIKVNSQKKKKNIKVNSILNFLHACYPIPYRNVTKLTDREPSAGKLGFSGTICTTSPAAARVDGAAVLTRASDVMTAHHKQPVGDVLACGMMTLSCELRLPPPLHALSTPMCVCGF
jgi:hypothetical protein